MQSACSRYVQNPEARLVARPRAWHTNRNRRLDTRAKTVSLSQGEQSNTVDGLTAVDSYAELAAPKCTLATLARGGTLCVQQRASEHTFSTLQSSVCAQWRTLPGC